MTEDWQRVFNVRRLPTYGTLAAELLLLRYVWPTNPLTQHAEGADITDQSSQAVEQPAAICLMVRRRVFTELGDWTNDSRRCGSRTSDLCRRLLEPAGPSSSCRARTSGIWAASRWPRSATPA